MKRRIISAFAAVFILIPCVVTAVSALTPSYIPTDAYKSSVYYERLLNVKLTGDGRRDMVTVAMSQLGYHEGDSKSDFDGLNQSGSNNYVEYNYANRDTYSAGGSYSYAWCASFVTWCARQAGISTSTIINSVSCDNFVANFKSKSQYKTRASGYVPKAGDLIFYKSSDSDRTYASHVGIVVGTDGTNVYTIEGNTSRGLVNYRKYAMSNTYIVGYAIPSYSGVLGNYSDFELRSGYVEAGIHKVNASSLNMRSEPKNSGSVIASIPYGTKLTINECSGDWGKVTYNGKTGWVYLTYVTSQGYLTFVITYNANGGDAAPAQTVKKSGVDVKISTEIPKRTGHIFLGWAKKSNATSADFKSGAVYSADENLKLYAVWEPISVKIQFLDHDGSAINTKTYSYGDTVTVPKNPTRESDEKYDYVFKGWDKDIQKTAKYDCVYTAVYEKIAIPSKPVETEKEETSGSSETTVNTPQDEILTSLPIDETEPEMSVPDTSENDSNISATQEGCFQTSAGFALIAMIALIAGTACIMAIKTKI